MQNKAKCEVKQKAGKRKGLTGALKGSLTVEMSYIMPVILLVMMGMLLVVFYFHDKNILAGAAYETAVVGSTRARQKEGVKQGEMQELLQDRLSGKCILFSNAKGEVQITDKDIQVTVRASKKGMSVSVNKRAGITDPEKYIREMRRIGK